MSNLPQAAEAATAGALIQAAVTHHQTGRLAQAEALYRQVLQQEPDNAGVMHLLGLIAHQVGQPENAASLIARAIQINPSAIMYGDLGLVFDAQGKRELAIECFRQAIARKPDSADAHYQLGAALHRQGGLDEAVTQCRQALTLNPNHAKAYATLGDIYFDRGQFEQAQEAIIKLLELDTEIPLAWALLARLRKMTPADEPILRKMQALLDKVGPAATSEDAIGLLFAIGKFHDDTGQYDSAFSAYSQANARRRKRNGEFDHAALTQLVDAQISTYTVEYVRKLHEGCSSSKRPVLVVGMPRSGTSLTEQIIASHPTAFGAGELRFWVNASLANAATELGGNYDPALLDKLATDYEHLLQQHSETASRVVDKLPGNFWRLGLISTVFPQARIIHMRRNPVDTCLSIYCQNFDANYSYATDLEDIALYYREYARLMAHWRSVFPAGRFLEVPYEALTEDQEGWSRRIIEFLGLEWDRHCLDFHKTERKVGTASNWQVRQKIYQTSKERWRNYEKHLGPLLGLLEADA